MSAILDAIKASIPQECYNMPITKLAAFAFMTTARVRRLGVCMTLSDDRVFEFKENRPVSHMGQVEKLGLKKLLSWTDSVQGIERSFAVAALNACVELNGKKYFEGNALALAARLGAGKRVVVVGHFPHMAQVKAAASDFKVLEKRPREGDLDADEAVNVIPQADVVAMTGVTCLNDTIEGLLALKKPGAKIIVLGPSVPLSPVLFDYGVDVIGGAWSEDEQDVYLKSSQGGTPRCIDGLKSVLYPKDPELLDGMKEIFPPKN